MSESFPIYSLETLNSYKEKGILVSCFGHYLNAHPHLLTPHKHHFYHFVLFTEGSGELSIDFKKYRIEPGLIYFMIPGQVHSWNFDKQPEGYIINFTPGFFQDFLLDAAYINKFPFFSGNENERASVLPKETQEKIIPVFEEILAEEKNESKGTDDLVKILLLKVFIETLRSRQPQGNGQLSSYNQTLLQNFKNLIEQNYHQLKLPKQYAALLYITPNHLNALCNDVLGISAGKLIRDRILLEAKRLLINLDLRINEIADKLRFKDQSYFIKFFKKYEGLTPEKFRKSIINEK